MKILAFLIEWLNLPIFNWKTLFCCGWRMTIPTDDGFIQLSIGSFCSFGCNVTYKLQPTTSLTPSENMFAVKLLLNLSFKTWVTWLMHGLHQHRNFLVAVHDAWMHHYKSSEHLHFWPKRNVTLLTTLWFVDQTKMFARCLPYWQPSVVQIHWWNWLSHRTWIMVKKVRGEKKHTHTHTLMAMIPSS